MPANKNIPQLLPSIRDVAVVRDDSPQLWHRYVDLGVAKWLTEQMRTHQSSRDRRRLHTILNYLPPHLIRSVAPADLLLIAKNQLSAQNLISIVEKHFDDHDRLEAQILLAMDRKEWSDAETLQKYSELHQLLQRAVDVAYEGL